MDAQIYPPPDPGEKLIMAEWKRRAADGELEAMQVFGMIAPCNPSSQANTLEPVGL